MVHCRMELGLLRKSQSIAMLKFRPLFVSFQVSLESGCLHLILGFQIWE